MRTNGDDGGRALTELRGPDPARGPFGSKESGGRNERSGRPRFTAPMRSLLIFFVSLAACGVLAWWLWARFRVRFYFFFIPLIGIGGPFFGRLQRKPAEHEPPLWDAEDRDRAPRLLEDKTENENDRGDGRRSERR